jgi:hypothetical protein
LQSLLRGRRLEDELHHLPVAFVQVVPVVEDVEEPVLQRELVGERRLGGDVCVDDGCLSFEQPLLPAQIPATGVERIPREVEVVLEEALRELGRGRADRDEVAAAPRAA